MDPQLSSTEVYVFLSKDITCMHQDGLLAGTNAAVQQHHSHCILEDTLCLQNLRLTYNSLVQLPKPVAA